MAKLDFAKSKTPYHLQLKGFVEGADFDRKAVENILKRTRESRSNILIDSTGGKLTYGLSKALPSKNLTPWPSSSFDSALPRYCVHSQYSG